MRQIIFAITFLGCVFTFSLAFGTVMFPIHTIRGVHSPFGGNPGHCAPLLGICDLEGGDDFPFADYSQPHEQAGFDENGNLVIEFVNYDFDNDEWLKGEDLILKGDYVMSEEIARYLGGDPVTVKAGRYRLEYHAKQNTKSVVFE